MNPVDILLLAAILLALALAARKCVRDRKNGRTCDGNCANCGHGCGK